jgi:hypothetical protein
MAEYIVAIDRVTYYAVQAEDEVTAIDLVLEGEGLEISTETRDAYIAEYYGSDHDRTPDLWTDRSKHPSIKD